MFHSSKLWRVQGENIACSSSTFTRDAFFSCSSLFGTPFRRSNDDHVGSWQLAVKLRAYRSEVWICNLCKVCGRVKACGESCKKMSKRRAVGWYLAKQIRWISSYFLNIVTYLFCTYSKFKLNIINYVVSHQPWHKCYLPCLNYCQILYVLFDGW